MTQSIALVIVLGMVVLGSVTMALADGDGGSERHRYSNHSDRR